MLVWCVGWSKSVSSNSVAVIGVNYDCSYWQLLLVLFEMQQEPKKVQIRGAVSEWFKKISL